MCEKSKIFLLVFMTGVFFAGALFGADSGKKVVVREGSAIERMGGRLRMVKAEDAAEYMKFEGVDVWLFELGEDVNDFRNVLKAGAELQLLPSSALEKLIDDFEKHPDSSYRLWGRITKYKGVNYIFTDFFMPVVEIVPAGFDVPNEVTEPNKAGPTDANSVAEPNEPADPNIAVETGSEAESNDVKEVEEPVQPAIEKIEIAKPQTDANSILTVPKEVLDKLNDNKILLPRKIEPRVEHTPRKFEPREVVLPEKKIKDEVEPKEKPEPNSVSAGNGQKGIRADSPVSDKAEAAEKPVMRLDSVIVDRSARLVKRDGKLPIFVLDALGLAGAEGSLNVLPCEVLELTELRVGAALNPLRFKIAGIRTKFKGTEYLLLQKATRVYGHGNFGN
ncbi:MAG: hypothetical protein ACYS8Z_14540 [Planctomycetota bacterium]|jgi:hypothetical protein